MRRPLLAFRDVTKRFGAARALSSVTFDVRAGELVVVVGPNGSGKTTLLRLAATLDEPTSGRVEVGGADAAQDGAAARAHVAWLGQEPGLYLDLTVRENLAFVARFHARGGRAADAVARAAQDFGIDDRLDDRVRRLSRGQRQRAALARAWLAGPLLLLDEPTTALDDKAAARAIDTLCAARPERTLVVATHDAALISRADRVLRLDGGRLA